MKIGGVLLVLLAAIADSGCSGGCRDNDGELGILSVEYQAWLASGDCDWRSQTAALKPDAAKCPTPDEAKEYFNRCTVSTVQLVTASFVRYQGPDSCVYQMHGRMCT